MSQRFCPGHANSGLLVELVGREMLRLGLDPLGILGLLALCFQRCLRMLCLDSLSVLHLPDIDCCPGLDRCGGNIQSYGLQLPVPIAGFIDLDGGDVDP